jgi:hypothetical protein
VSPEEEEAAAAGQLAPIALPQEAVEKGRESAHPPERGRDQAWRRDVVRPGLQAKEGLPDAAIAMQQPVDPPSHVRSGKCRIQRRVLQCAVVRVKDLGNGGERVEAPRGRAPGRRRR